jgi:hypothetical protein
MFMEEVNQFMKQTKKGGLGHERSETNCKTTQKEKRKKGYGPTRS